MGVWGASRSSLEAIFEEGIKKTLKMVWIYEPGSSVFGKPFRIVLDAHFVGYFDALPDRVSKDFGTPKPAKKYLWDVILIVFQGPSISRFL